MPLPIPTIDDRRYKDLVDELVARIPVHTPEWTNFNAADPGITLIHLFAHLTESMLYRANQIPERNRLKFLQLLGIGLGPAQEARGLVGFANEQGERGGLVIPAGTQLAAGSVAFRTTTGLDVLPIESRCYVKRSLTPDAALAAYYAMLYASYGRPAPDGYALYETVEIDPAKGVDFAQAMDRTVWIALLARKDEPAANPTDPWVELREALAGRTLSLGLVPDTAAQTRILAPAAEASPIEQVLSFALPRGDLAVPLDEEGAPAPSYQQLAARADFDPLTTAGIVELALPEASRLAGWSALDPLEAGVGELPPFIEDDRVAGRIVTWLKISAGAAASVRLAWLGINAAQVRQRIEVNAERLGEGDGTPGQRFPLARRPVLAGSVKIAGVAGTVRREWQPIDDIAAADPEVPLHDPAAPPRELQPDRFTLDAEAGVVAFGDGLTGRRPARGEVLYASYAYCEGREGNVGAGAINRGPLLPAGVRVANPVPTWGGADSESVADGEKQIRRRLQNRDRLVTAADFVSIAWRTPGIDLGRIEVIPAAHPDVWPVTPGSVPGAVTIMAVPAFDAAFPAAPRPDRLFVDALCGYLDPRRLVTTELAIRGPSYVGIWVSVGIEIAGGQSAAEVTERVKAQVKAHLSPLPREGLSVRDLIEPLYAPEGDPALRGWPLGRAVNARTILAEVARVPGVVSVADVLLAQGAGPAVESVGIEGLELPELLGISVAIGDPAPLDQLRGAHSVDGAQVRRLPVPVLAETC
jgi:hypothetical protein